MPFPDVADSPVIVCRITVSIGFLWLFKDLGTTERLVEFIYFRYLHTAFPGYKTADKFDSFPQIILWLWKYSSRAEWSGGLSVWMSVLGIYIGVYLDYFQIHCLGNELPTIRCMFQRSMLGDLRGVSNLIHTTTLQVRLELDYTVSFRAGRGSGYRSPGSNTSLAVKINRLLKTSKNDFTWQVLQRLWKFFHSISTFSSMSLLLVSLYSISRLSSMSLL